jgi:hypothetical protein
MRPPQWALRLYSSYLAQRTGRALADPKAAQAQLLKRILSLYAPTELGAALQLGAVSGPDDFRDRVPVTEEPFYRPIFERVLAENPPDAVTAGRLQYVARTSGTTQASKLIPYTPALIAAFKRFETKLAMLTMRDLGNYGLLGGNLLITAGSPVVEERPHGLTVGYASGIMTRLAPAMAKEIVRPTRDIQVLDSWEEKIPATVRQAIPLDVRVMTGIPVFVIPILERLLKEAAALGRPAADAHHVWKNLGVYYWSGSPIALYEERLRQLFGAGVKFREIYAAAEAPLAYQHRDGQNGLALDVENTYFEFQPEGSDLDAPRLRVHEVAPGVRYRILITTLGGLCAYRLGDVVEFVETAPPLIRFVGREQEEINLGFEKLPLHQVRSSLEAVRAAFGLTIRNFFLCPAPGEKTAYHWYIEFEQPPADPAAFAAALDARLQADHRLYANMRHDDFILGAPFVEALPVGTIERYVLETRQFGQGKFVHLYNQREVPMQILAHGEPANG